MVALMCLQSAFCQKKKGWLYSGSKWVADGHVRHGHSLSKLAHDRARSERFLMRKRVEQAWRLRWGSFLSCAAARAVAMSLLDLPGSRGSDGTCPLPHDVERDFRHAGLDVG